MNPSSRFLGALLARGRSAFASFAAEEFVESNPELARTVAGDPFAAWRAVLVECTEALAAAADPELPGGLRPTPPMVAGGAAGAKSPGGGLSPGAEGARRGSPHSPGPGPRRGRNAAFSSARRIRCRRGDEYALDRGSRVACRWWLSPPGASRRALRILLMESTRHAR